MTSSNATIARRAITAAVMVAAFAGSFLIGRSLNDNADAPHHHSHGASQGGGLEIAGLPSATRLERGPRPPELIAEQAPKPRRPERKPAVALTDTSAEQPAAAPDLAESAATAPVAPAAAPPTDTTPVPASAASPGDSSAPQPSGGFDDSG